MSVTIRWGDTMTPIDAVQFIHEYRPGASIKWNGDWAIHQCIIDDFEPHHANGDKNASAGLNTKTGYYNCFVYSDHSISFKDLCRIVGKNYRFESQERLPDDIDKAIVDAINPPQDDGANSIDMSIYSKVHHPYLTDTRHLSDDVIDRAGIRYDQFSGRIAFPIMEDGKVIAIQRRRLSTPSIDGHVYQKYENSKNFDKSKHLYHIEPLDVHEPLLVVESIMSVLRAWDYGIKNCCALFGSRLSPVQAEKLKKFDVIILDLDGDESGIHGVQGALQKLTGPHVYVLDTVPYGSKDLADLGPKRFFEVFSKPLMPFEWEYKYGNIK